ncbi:AbrB/MazE/SpoVT family DNA-binding domain-containing protein [Thermus tenuipuniceus]|uniref:AbrB/MazE/SpoVT family DNA-binding domain-containing protein n=1 Tax=Thermus tenuipuniceus TaxID=2078690 RepID=UPI000CF845A2|nr:AbrB/MazE/SpoVT family DNA-binding domain-containing protein [Thermus tenuipuniceus]
MVGAKKKAHYVVQVGSKGRVVLPAEVREALGLREGERLLSTVEPEGTVRVEPLRKAVEEVYGLFRNVAPGVSLVEELIRERREEARREELA